MIRDYQLVSPSLEGVLSDSALSYEGLCRPPRLLRVRDCATADSSITKEETKELEDYFHDLYGIFMKRLSFFLVQSESQSEDTIKLQAMLQELIKVKRLMSR